MVQADDTLCDQQNVVLSIGDLCVRCTYVCKVPHTEFIPSGGEAFFMKKKAKETKKTKRNLFNFRPLGYHKYERNTAPGNILLTA